LLPNRNQQSYQTRSLTWWANDKPEVETLLRELLGRRRSKPTTISKKKSKAPIYLVTIFFHDHGNAEDFYFGKLNTHKGTVQLELDLTRIAAHGRKQRLNCAMEDTETIALKEISDDDRLVLLKEEEYKTLQGLVIDKLQ